MANIKISELNELETRHRNDLLPIVNSSNNETEKIKVENLINENVELIAVSPTAPSECSLGDKYFNTTSNKLYTATATNTWSSTGENAVEGILYVVFGDQSTYAYNGTTLVSVGGGSGSSDIVVVPTETPTEETKLEIEDEDFDFRGSEITDEYSESTEVGYSARYTNNLNTYSTTEKRVGTWIDGKPIYRKVIHLTNVIRGYKDYAHNINNLGNVIEIGGYVSISDGYNPVSRVVADNITGAGFGVINIDTQNLHTLAGSSFPTTNDVYIILEYTKTTD